MRRLPVYILIDTSTSMRGEPIEAVKMGIHSLLDSLCKDPYALETVCLSVITYNSIAEQVLPLTEVYKVHFPDIIAKGRSVLGEALMLLSEKVDLEVRKTTSTQKGDWKPLLFLLSDGGHTGPIAKPISELKKRKFGIVVACAAGKKSHLDLLHKITENVVQISTTDTVSIKSYFKWVSNSISARSLKLEDATKGDFTIEELPPLPDEIMMLHSNENN